VSLDKVGSGTPESFRYAICLTEEAQVYVLTDSLKEGYGPENFLEKCDVSRRFVYRFLEDSRRALWRPE
jgi:hypothetical protein